MSPRDTPEQQPPADDGANTAAQGTPVAVDVTRDRRRRILWAVFLAGPVILISHFLLVYLVAEAGCTGGGDGLRLFDPPVPAVVTLIATAGAVVASVVATVWGYRWWRASDVGPGTGDAGPEGRIGDDEAGGLLAFGGALLSALSALTVLFVGYSAIPFPGC